jgi:hypothetical protein
MLRDAMQNLWIWAVPLRVVSCMLAFCLPSLHQLIDLILE